MKRGIQPKEERKRRDKTLHFIQNLLITFVAGNNANL